MRILDFIIEGQSIRPDPKCDFTGLEPDSEGYLSARFSFSPEWDGCVKVAAFFSNLGKEYEPQVIDKYSTCTIPADALRRRVFKIKVIGQRDDFKISTNKVSVEQKGGKS